VIPEPWEFALLALAAFRIWKLIGDDAVLDRPRAWALAQLDARFSNKGDVLDYFITCPWCAGFWISLAWWGAWLLWPHGTLVAAALWSLSAVVGYLGVGIDKLEE